MARKLKKIMLARYYGFCVGVKRAIRIAEKAGSTETGPVNVVNEIVHNDSVVKKMAEKGVGSLSSVTEAQGGTIIVSAHGAPPSLFAAAKKKGLKIIDATCPLVIRIHKIIHKLVDNGYEIIHYGDLNHDETKGVVGQAPAGRIKVIRDIEELRALSFDNHKIALTAQTTAGVSDFTRIASEAKKIFPKIEVFNTICNATSQRQTAILDLAPEVNLMLIVGSQSSANSKRLRSISEAICRKAYLINSADSLDESWLDEVATVGVTAGASTPDFLVEEVIQRLLDYSGGTAEVIRPKASDKSSPSIEESSLLDL